jgi:hyperosmotically inducible periplasmic protein
MKNQIRCCALAICLTGATALTVGVTGCAGNRYERSTGEYIDDKAITARVKADLVADKEVSALDVKVQTFRGVVQLSGFVNTSRQKERAEEVARAAKGVKEVKNTIIVKTS